MRIYATFSIVLVCILCVSCNPQKKLSRHHNDLMDTYQTLKTDLPEATVSMDGEKVKVILPEAAMFNVNSDVINASYYTSFDKMAIIFSKYPKTNILITGFTDATGTESYNSELSKKRADAAQRLLTEKGINKSRIYTWGLGEKNPVANNESEDGRKLNRRVEVVVLYDYNKKNP